MTTPPSSPDARPQGPGWWVWAFAGLFLLLTGSALYFLLQPVPLARRLDPDRSALLPMEGDAVRVRVVVFDAPQGGQMIAVPRPPAKAGGPARVEIAWSSAPSADDGRPPGERTIEITLPKTDAVDVYDLRGGTSPEVLPLRLAPGRSGR